MPEEILVKSLTLKKGNIPYQVIKTADAFCSAVFFTIILKARFFVSGTGRVLAAFAETKK